MDMVNDGKDIRLDTPQAVKEALASGKDLYNPQTGEFWWEYNYTGSIANTYVHLDDPNLLAVIDNPDFDLYEAMRAAEIEQLDHHRAYREEHGFAPDTVAAFAHEHTECCQERVSRKGNRVLSYIDYLGHEQVCPIEHIRDSHLHGFDATEPGSFDRAIECHQLHNARNAGNDPITVKGEATAMKAASAEMADGAGKHDIGQDAR